MHFNANTVALILSVSSAALATPTAKFDDSVQVAPRSPGAGLDLYAREADPEAFDAEEDEHIYARGLVPDHSKIRAGGNAVKAAVKANDKKQQDTKAAAQDKVNASHSKELFPNGRGHNPFKPKRSVQARGLVPDHSKIRAGGNAVKAAVKANDKKQQDTKAAAQDKVNASHSKELFPNGRGHNPFKPKRSVYAREAEAEAEAEAYDSESEFENIYARGLVPDHSKIKAGGNAIKATVKAGDKHQQNIKAAAQDKVNAKHSHELFPNGRGHNPFKPKRSVYAREAEAEAEASDSEFEYENIYARGLVPDHSKIRAGGNAVKAAVKANDKKQQDTKAAAQDKVNASHSKELFPNGRGHNPFKPKRSVYVREADPIVEIYEYLAARGLVPDHSKIKAGGNAIKATIKAGDKHQQNIKAAAQDKVNAKHSHELFPNGRGHNPFKPKRSVYIREAEADPLDDIYEYLAARGLVPDHSKIRAGGNAIKAAVKANDKKQQDTKAAAQDKVNASHSKELFPNGRGHNPFKPKK